MSDSLICVSAVCPPAATNVHHSGWDACSHLQGGLLSDQVKPIVKTGYMTGLLQSDFLLVTSPGSMYNEQVRDLVYRVCHTLAAHKWLSCVKAGLWHAQKQELTWHSLLLVTKLLCWMHGLIAVNKHQMKHAPELLGIHPSLTRRCAVNDPPVGPHNKVIRLPLVPVYLTV